MFALQPIPSGTTYNQDVGGELSSSGSNSPVYQELQDSFISYWPLDETTAGTYEDIISGHDGAEATNPPIPVTGQVSGAQDFTSGNLRINVAHHADFNLGGSDPFSVELWVKTTQASGTRVFIGKFLFGNDTWWVGLENSAGNVTFYMRDSTGSSTRATSTVSVNDGDWHHIVAVKDPQVNQMRLYIDNVIAASASRTFTGTITNSNPITIGYFDGSYFYDGLLDEIAIYDQALTVGQIDDHYAKSLAGQRYNYEDGAHKEFLSGSVSPSSGDIEKLVSKILSRAVSFISDKKALVSKGVSGTLDTLGSFYRAKLMSLGGVLSLGGEPFFLKGKLLSSALSTSSGLISLTSRVLSGALDLSGLAKSSTTKFVSGAIDLYGDIHNLLSRLLSSALSQSGNITRVPGKIVDGEINSSGLTTKNVQRILSSSISLVGDILTEYISGAQEYFKELFSELGLSGNDTRSTQTTKQGVLSDLEGNVYKTTQKAIAAALALSGSLRTIVLLVLSGVLTTSGIITKSILSVLDSALEFSGLVTKTSQRLFSSSLSFSGVVDTVKSALVFIASSLSPAGAMIKRTGKSTIGLLGLSGAREKLSNITLAASLAFQGLLDTSGDLTMYLVGAMSPSGGISKLASRLIESSMDFVSMLTKRMWVGVSGALNLEGAIGSIKSILVLLSGVLSSSGRISKGMYKAIEGAVDFVSSTYKSMLSLLSGSLLPESTIDRVTSKITQAALSFAGSIGVVRIILASIASELGLDGSISRLPIKYLTGILSSDGKAQRLVSVLRSGALSLYGVVGTGAEIIVVLFGAMTPSGSLVKTISRIISGTVSYAGILGFLTNKRVSGIVSPVGDRIKVVARMISSTLDFISQLDTSGVLSVFLSGGLALSGAVDLLRVKLLSSGLSFVGSSGRAISKALAGVVGFFGSLVGPLFGVRVVRVVLSDEEVTTIGMTDSSVVTLDISDIDIT